MPHRDRCRVRPRGRAVQPGDASRAVRLGAVVAFAAVAACEDGLSSVCGVANGGCDPLVSCAEVGGRPRCGDCPTGYSGTGDTQCVDVDECATFHGGCDRLTECHNTRGGRSCSPCPTGYAGTGETRCVLVDPCVVDNGGCDPLTGCQMTASGPSCSDCPAGYAGTGATGCVDVDECASGNGGCDPLTECRNTAGGRSCTACPAGYTGTGEVGCFDVDECAVDDGGCDAGLRCANLPGGHSCLAPCPPDRIPEGAACLAKETVTIAGVPYTAIHADDDPFRIVCQQPCTLDEETLLAQYRGFVAARAVLLPVTGIDVPARGIPFDLHLQSDDWCGTWTPGGYAGWSWMYDPGTLGPDSVNGSYACLFLVENGHDLTPAVLARVDEQMLQVHEFVHALFFRRHVWSYEDFAYALSFYVSAARPVTDACSPVLDDPGRGRLLHRLCEANGFQYADLAPALRQLDQLYQQHLGFGDPWSPVMGREMGTDLLQLRTVLDPVLGSDTTATFIEAGFSPPTVGDTATLSPAGGRYSMIGGRVVVDLLPGAVAEDTPIIVDAVRYAPTHPYLSFETIYDIVPVDRIDPPLQYVPLAAGATVSIRYAPEQLAEGTVESSLRLLKMGESPPHWDVVPDSVVDTVSRVVKGTVHELGAYAVLPAP